MAATDPTIAAISTALDAPHIEHAWWGVRIETLDGRVLFDRNGHRSFIPASNNKILSTGAALHFLGPDATFETRLEAVGKEAKPGVWQGDLVIRGGGDPTLGSFHLEEEDPHRAPFPQWARVLREAGVRGFTGDLIGDGTLFTPDQYAGGWEYEDLASNEGTSTSGLAYHENGFLFTIHPGDAPGDRGRLRLSPASPYLTVYNDIQTGPRDSPLDARVLHRSPEENVIRFGGCIPVGHEGRRDFCHLYNGPAFAATCLMEELQAEEIMMGGTPVGRTSPPEQPTASGDVHTRLLASSVSPPLARIVALVNKPSNNFMADMLLRHVGLRVEGEGSFAAGARAVTKWLEQLDVPEPEAVQMLDGSGLARRNLVQPRQLTAILRGIWRQEKYRDIFHDSLPIGGEGPDLGTRLTEPPVAGNVHAKTGLVPAVRTFSGYVRCATGQRIVFSLMANHYRVPWQKVDETIDEVCRLLAGMELAD